MSDTLFIPNPLWWVHLRLLGGVRRFMLIGLVYAFGLTGAFMAFRRFFGDITLSSYCDGAIDVLTGVQTIVMILGGCNAVHRAVVRDVSAKMLESHRISPMSGPTIGLGYLFGSTLQVLMLYLIGVMAGVVVIQWGTLGVSSWLGGNVYLLALAVMAWSATLLFGLGPKKPISPMAIGIMLSLASSMFFVVPALGLLTGVFAGFVACGWMVGSLPVPPWGAAALAAITLGLSVLWLHAAVRKYRRPDLPAFSMARGLGFLLFWLALNALGVWGFRGLAPRWAIHARGDDLWSLFFNALAGSLLVALLAIGAAAQTHCRMARGGRCERIGDRLGIVTVPLFCAILLVSFMAFGAWVGLFYVVSIEHLIAGILAMVAPLVAVEGMFVRLSARQFKLLRGGLVFVALTWVLPPVADLIQQEYTGRRPDVVVHVPLDQSPAGGAVFTAVGGFSPVGTLYAMIDPRYINVWPGLGFQAVVALGMSYLGHRALQHLRRRRTAPAPPRHPLGLAT
jgi:hypothetical protein